MKRRLWPNKEKQMAIRRADPEWLVLMDTFADAFACKLVLEIEAKANKKGTD